MIPYILSVIVFSLCSSLYCLAPHEFTLSKHAFVRMQERGIGPCDITKTLVRGKREVIDGKVIYTLGRPWGPQKKCVSLVYNETDQRVVTVMKKPEDETEAIITKKKLLRRKKDHAQNGRSIIPHLFFLEPTTPLEKNIAKAILQNDASMARRLLALGAPYKRNDQLIGRCFMTAVNFNQSDCARMILEQATSFDQLTAITKDDSFRMLEPDSEYPQLLREYSIPLLTQKATRHIQQEQNLFTLSTTIPLEKNISQAITDYNFQKVQEYLLHRAPFSRNDILLARCFMYAVHRHKKEIAQLILQQATSFDQLSAITKDDSFRMLEPDSEYPTLLRRYAIPLLKQKMVKELSNK